MNSTLRIWFERQIKRTEPRNGKITWSDEDNDDHNDDEDDDDDDDDARMMVMMKEEITFTLFCCSPT